MNTRGVILAVDDSPEALIVLTDILTAEGYEMRQADSGELALSAVRAAQPELIILDIQMTGMDGFEVCRRLKANPESQHIPVIFLTSLNETRECVEGLKLGAVDFIPKPFQKEELLARIQTHLELSRLRSRLEERVAGRTASLHAANQRLLLELGERRRAENALRESEERFRSMADNAPVVIWTSGPDRTFTFLNQYGHTFIGRKPGKFEDDRSTEAVNPEDLGLQFEEYTAVIAAGQEYRKEVCIRRADGEYQWLLHTVTPRLLNDGSLAGYIGIAVDITDLKHNMEQLMAAQKLESLGLLVAGVAHTFNNLMATIIAEADLAMSSLPAGTTAYQNAERISSIAMRAADFVSLFRAYAGSGSPGTLALIDVSAVVRETFQLLQPTVSRNVVFSAALDEKLPDIYADLSQIRQVVMNLLTNACESLPGGQGSVHVATSCVVLSDGSHRLGLARGEYVQLRVTDNGCGIPAEAQPRIFDPFYTTKFLGRGLGLAAVQGIVCNLGGSIHLQSTSGQGATFEILLPSGNSGRLASFD